MILLLLDSVGVFNDALKIGSICSQLPLSLSLDPFQHLGFLAGGFGNSFDYASSLSVLPCVRVREGLWLLSHLFQISLEPCGKLVSR